jgi:hypothetical protein
MFFDYESEMCIGETYAINVWDKFDDPIKNALVTIHYPDGDSMESRTKLEGNILFTPELEGVYRLDAQGPSGYDDIKLSANHQFTARDCSLIDVCPDPTKENYILVVDNPPFDCQYACSITECPDGFDLVDDSLGCRCALLICPPRENYDLVIDDYTTCKYACAIDQDYCESEFGEDYVFDVEDCACVYDDDISEMELMIDQDIELPDIELGVNEVCAGLPFIVEIVSLDDGCFANPQLDIGDAGIYGTSNLNNLVITEVGTYEAILRSSGCRTASTVIKVIDCGEMDFEDPTIDIPLESQFWDDIINIFRNSIKGGCEGFYFEGLPTILCDLVWVIVILGSIGAAYLEPLRNRKVISLVTPSVVAIVLIPLAGAIAAAVVVYLAYNSKKHVEGKLEYEREQMEEEINK